MVIFHQNEWYYDIMILLSNLVPHHIELFEMKGCIEQCKHSLLERVNIVVGVVWLAFLIKKDNLYILYTPNFSEIWNKMHASEAFKEIHFTMLYAKYLAFSSFNEFSKRDHLESCQDPVWSDMGKSRKT